MPPAQYKQHLEQSCTHLWQPTRELLKQPMLISSGYRCPALNRAVGGSATSAHCVGYAIDFTCPDFGTPRKVTLFLVNALKAHGIAFDQMIFEFGRWVHLAYKSPAGEQRGQVLTAKLVKGKTVYLNGIAGE